MTVTASHTHTTVVIDNADYAWRNALESARTYHQLDADFVHDYRAQLDQAATVLFGPILVQVWAENGYSVTFGPDGDTMLRRHTDRPWHKVWDEAARRLNPHAIVIKASELTGHSLDDELLRYAAAHPRAEQLSRHCAALRRCTAGVRADLHARLDAHADTFTTETCEQAWAQIDGWRNAIDTAVTRAQLEQLAADIPA